MKNLFKKICVIVMSLSLFTISLKCLCVTEAAENPQALPPVYFGDVNHDFKVDSSDALEVLKSLSQMCKLEVHQRIAADVNYDEIVNADDALQILRVAAKLDTFDAELRLTYVDLSVNEEYVINKIFDVSYYVWNYEVDKSNGITINKTVEELPVGSNPGDTPEQIYTIVADEAGVYELHLKQCSLFDPKDVVEERVYIISVEYELDYEQLKSGGLIHRLFFDSDGYVVRAMYTSD